MLLPLRPSAAGFAVEACRTSSATAFSTAQCCGRIVASSQPIAGSRPPFFGNTTPRNTTAQHMRTRASDTMSRKSLRRTGAPVGRRLQYRTNAMYSGWEGEAWTTEMHPAEQFHLVNYARQHSNPHLNRSVKDKDM